MKIDWPDIAVHTAVAAMVSIGMGIGAAMGLAYGGFVGWTLVALCLAGNAANSLFWPIREREQHRDASWTPQWGGFQSHLEWAFPSVAAWVMFAVILAIG